jgi:hypothetical protein
MTTFLLVLFVVLTAVASVFAFRFRLHNAELSTRFAGILDLESATEKAKQKLDVATSASREFERGEQERRNKLSQEFEAALQKRNQLTSEINLLEENLEDISFGIYKPHFNFETAENYKQALEKLRDQERLLVKSGQASTCPIHWSVGGSGKDGERMTKQYTKIMLRAFNAECEAALANVSWNNITKMEERIRKAFDAINELGGVMKMSITSKYLQLKVDELRLSFELEDKKHIEKEVQKQIREKMREEEKTQQEIEKVKEESEASEAIYEKSLSKARAEVLKATGEQMIALTEQIKTFEGKLDEARKKKERAIARAQLTKSGFVYVISNVGSFGERVFKIGMTRRLEPMERVIELGDASVPFPFDVHAMLYCDNAPDLEAALHKHFEEKRVNLVNARKEFYAEVDLQEVELIVKKKGLSAQFMPLPEAREYRQSLALRAQKIPAASAVAKEDNKLFTTAG